MEYTHNELDWKQRVLGKIEALESKCATMERRAPNFDTNKWSEDIDRKISNLESKCARLQEHDANREMDLVSLKDKCARLEEMNNQLYGGNNWITAIKSPEKKAPTCDQCANFYNSGYGDGLTAAKDVYTAGRDEAPGKKETKDYHVCACGSKDCELHDESDFKPSPAPEKTLMTIAKIIRVNSGWDIGEKECVTIAEIILKNFDLNPKKSAL